MQYPSTWPVSKLTKLLFLLPGDLNVDFTAQCSDKCNDLFFFKRPDCSLQWLLEATQTMTWSPEERWSHVCKSGRPFSVLHTTNKYTHTYIYIILVKKNVFLMFGIRLIIMAKVNIFNKLVISSAAHLMFRL